MLVCTLLRTLAAWAAACSVLHPPAGETRTLGAGDACQLESAARSKAVASRTPGISKTSKRRKTFPKEVLRVWGKSLSEYGPADACGARRCDELLSLSSVALATSTFIRLARLPRSGLSGPLGGLSSAALCAKVHLSPTLHRPNSWCRHIRLFSRVCSIERDQRQLRTQGLGWKKNLLTSFSQRI